MDTVSVSIHACVSVLSLKGILLVYDITNRWSFDGIDRWITEIDEVRWGGGDGEEEVMWRRR